MTGKPYILLIAPSAPPKNSAEAIQVRRILSELDKQAAGRLVTVKANETSWARTDASLELEMQNFDRQELGLPMHSFVSRMLMSHRMSYFHIPDSMFWLGYMGNHVTSALVQKPDIIYSRSSPMSAALLALKVKQKLKDVPWIMHLSDPWADNPYKDPNLRDELIEKKCFKRADLITLTTEGQAEFYRNKYPRLASKIVVSPNVMPDLQETQHWLEQGREAKKSDYLQLVFAGNLYANRSPEPLVKAIEILRKTKPEILQKLRIDVFGHAQQEPLVQLRQAMDVIHYHGPVSFREAYGAQHEADVVVTIEADSTHPLIKETLLSKVTDCLAQGKPMLAITPDGSETSRICNQGYGWAIAPSRPHELAARIEECVNNLPELRSKTPKPPPAYYTAKQVVDDLMVRITGLLALRPS